MGRDRRGGLVRGREEGKGIEEGGRKEGSWVKQRRGRGRVRRRG